MLVKLPIFYGTPIFFTVVKTARHLSLLEEDKLCPNPTILFLSYPL